MGAFLLDLNPYLTLKVKGTKAIDLFKLCFEKERVTTAHALGSDVASVKRILFNDEGIWLKGYSKGWFMPETRAFCNENEQDH
jgi:hypothetical protein